MPPESPQIKVSFILPTLDEAENIVPLMEKLIEVTPHLWEILVVDDDSKDRTWNIASQYAAKQKTVNIRVIRRMENHSLTGSISDGIRASTGNIVAWMDCDFSMPPELTGQLVGLLEQGYDIAVGSRFTPGGSFKRDTKGTQDSWIAVVLSRLMNYFIQILLDHRFKDYTSGYIAARREIFEHITLKGDYGEYFIDLIFRALRAGLKTKEVPYICMPRLRGYSKTGQNLLQFLRRGWKYVAVAVKLRAIATFAPHRLKY